MNPGCMIRGCRTEARPTCFFFSYCKKKRNKQRTAAPEILLFAQDSWQATPNPRSCHKTGTERTVG